MAQRTADCIEGEETATSAAPPACSLCTVSPARRRGLCWTCDRKLRECAVERPPDGRLGEPLEARLTAWLSRWSPDARANLAAVLGRLT